MYLENRELMIVLRAILVVTLGTIVGHYFPDLTISSFIIYVCAAIATKNLTNFNWWGAVLLFIALAGIQNTGGDIPTFLVGRCLIGSIMAVSLNQQDL